MPKTLSVICVYNNKQILESFLLESLKKQNINYELILINNVNNEFTSAAKALNYAATKATGDYLLFVHQDIFFYDSNILKDLLYYAQSKPNAIIGIAGTTENNEVLTNILHDIPPRPAGKRIDGIHKVETVDECLFLIDRNIFNKIKFDENSINGWHLYAVDYCLEAKKYGYPSYVIGIDNIYHRSPGFSFNNQYFLILKQIIHKHRQIKYIYTTMGKWPTNTFKLNFKINLKKIKSKIKMVLFQKVKIEKTRYKQTEK
jgi:GT2 family glycosyltransferase